MLRLQEGKEGSDTQGFTIITGRRIFRPSRVVFPARSRHMHQTDEPVIPGRRFHRPACTSRSLTLFRRKGTGNRLILTRRLTR